MSRYRKIKNVCEYGSTKQGGCDAFFATPSLSTRNSNDQLFSQLSSFIIVVFFRTFTNGYMATVRFPTTRNHRIAATAWTGIYRVGRLEASPSIPKDATRIHFQREKTEVLPPSRSVHLT